MDGNDLMWPDRNVKLLSNALYDVRSHAVVLVSLISM